MIPKNLNLENHIQSFFTLSTVIFCYLIISTCLIGNVWAADVYIDPTYSGTETGSFDNPYNSWEDLTIKTGNDYRQKCGTTYVGTLNVTQYGTSDNHIIIGAYYDNQGVPEHEDDSPNFGQFCGNSSQKPIIKKALGSGNLVQTAAGGNQYLEVHSLQLRDGDIGFYFRSNYNIIRYSYLYNLYWGVRGGLNTAGADGDYNLVEYNYIDMNDSADEDNIGWDAVQLGVLADYNTVQYNKITGFDHGGINNYGGEGNISQYNHIIGDAGHEDFCINSSNNSDSATVRFNYCQDAGMGFSFMSGNNNEIYGNIFTCNTSPTPWPYQGCVQFNGPPSYQSSTNNKIYNNLIYDNDNNSGTNRGFTILAAISGGGPISGNEIANNIIMKTSDYCIKVHDTYGVVSSNTFYNNSCWDYPANKFADIEGEISADASTFNGRSYAANNRDMDPGLINPSALQFWPASNSSSVVGTGMDLGSNYNQILIPNESNITTSFFSLETINQPVDWYIGPFSIETLFSKPTVPISPPSGFSVAVKK
jgi:hypothetical protein